ncbi:Sulfate Permease (SulP) Family [Achlya hypogyna]|uniref:Sulfate Permease (SulP) Family n=1 Tax=Achlya hypogyna TaxID=1202772 RepID=A0A1V9Z4Y3_ACHHY|nr:Sulfate Permease (SulP) Family [Achlya hypogyna]
MASEAHLPALHQRVSTSISSTAAPDYVQVAANGDASFLQALRATAAHGGNRLRSAALRCRPSSAKPEALRGLPASLSASTRYYWANKTVFQREVLCGIAATLLQVPETVAFSYVANLDPVTGLYATGFFGIVVGLFGGVPATIAGAAGALGVVMPTITSGTGALAALPYADRVAHLFVAVFLAGVFQLVFGLLDLSRLFALIPRTAHIGFLNGLALMMLLSQKTTFQRCTSPELLFGACEQAGLLAWMEPSAPSTWMTLATVVITIVVMVYFPKVPVVGRFVPPTLVVAVVGVGLEFGINRPLLGYDVRTIGDTSKLAGALPTWHLPAFGAVADWPLVLSVAGSLAAVGLFESLMTLQAIVDLTKAPLSLAACRAECLAQGVGNVVCGLFQGMGGCSMIGQSTGNVLNGGRHRVSGVVCGLVTFAILLFASPVVERVPVACLTGILVVIIAHTFHWPSLRLLWYLPAADAAAIVLVTALAAAINLAVAVIAGVVWQALVTAWSSRDDVQATVRVECVDGTAVTVYELRGTLVFSSVARFRGLLHVANDLSVVVLDVGRCRLVDFSAVAALKEAAHRYRDAGKRLLLRHLDAHATDLLLQHDYGWEVVAADLGLAMDKCVDMNVRDINSPVAAYGQLHDV